MQPAQPITMKDVVLGGSRLESFAFLKGGDHAEAHVPKRGAVSRRRLLRQCGQRRSIGIDATSLMKEGLAMRFVSLAVELQTTLNFGWLSARLCVFSLVKIALFYALRPCPEVLRRLVDVAAGGRVLDRGVARRA